jgi:hypothetical protein
MVAPVAGSVGSLASWFQTQPRINKDPLADPWTLHQPQAHSPALRSTTRCHGSSRAMRLFCDQCGQEFTERTLRPDSNFCSFCGKALTDYIKQHCHILRPGQAKRKAEGEATPGRGRPRKYPVEKSAEREEIAVQDEYSTEENPESGGDEPVPAHRYTRIGS